ncbi:response regulator [Methylobacterium oryzae CBMB20]
MEATGILEDAGFRVLEAINVVQALRILNQHHDAIELLFTDVHMPGNADGFDLARQTTERWPHIGVVVASRPSRAWARGTCRTERRSSANRSARRSFGIMFAKHCLMLGTRSS